jgi:hypothetical protein
MCLQRKFGHFKKYRTILHRASANSKREFATTEWADERVHTGVDLRIIYQPNPNEMTTIKSLNVLTITSSFTCMFLRRQLICIYLFTDLFKLLALLTKINGEIRMPVRHNLRLDGGSLPLVFHTLLRLSCNKRRLEFFRTLHPFHCNKFLRLILSILCSLGMVPVPLYKSNELIIKCSVADPGSGVFRTSASGIRDGKKSRDRMRDPE